MGLFSSPAPKVPNTISGKTMAGLRGRAKEADRKAFRRKSFEDRLKSNARPYSWLYLHGSEDQQQQSRWS